MTHHPPKLDTTPPQDLQLGLAPMEGVTDLPTRLWLSLCSSFDYAITPFLRVTREFPFRRVPPTYACEGPKGAWTPYRLVPQLMGSDPLDVARIAMGLLETFPHFDLNCGCPAPRVVGNCAGSALLSTPDTLNGFLTPLLSEVGAQKMSVKMRVGFDSHEEFPALLDVVSKKPLVELTVHGRTRAERYTGQSRWSLIEQAALHRANPVVASGDVCDHHGLTARLRQAPHVTRVLIGRGALRNPWIFDELRSGRPVTLNSALLPVALSLLGLFHDADTENETLLLELLKEGHFSKALGPQDLDAWESLRRVTLAKMGRAPRAAPLLQRRSLAKVKMIWNYMRSSLPEPYWAADPLRSPDWDSFENALQDVGGHLLSGVNAPQLELCYWPRWDTLFSGGKSGEEKGSGTGALE